MVDNTIALSVQTPQANALGGFAEGRQAAATDSMNRMKQSAVAMEMIGAGAMYALGGRIDGEVDPAKYKEVLDSFESMGMDVSAYRNNPNFAKVAAQASVSALERMKLAREDRDYDLALAKFEQDITAKPQSPLGKLAADFEAGLIDQGTYDAARSKATQSSGGITIGPDGSVQIGGPAQGKFDQESAKAEVELIKGARESAGVAQELRSIAGQMEAVLPNVGYTGPGGELLGKVDDVIGILPGESGARGAMRQMSMDAQLAMTEKTKGAITDREMAMFKQAVPGLAQTGPGNRAMIQIMRAAAQRMETRVSFFERYKQTNGTLNGATEAWGRYMEENPLITEGEGGTVKLVGEKKAIDSYLSAPSSRSSGQARGGSQRVVEGVTYEQDEETGDWYEVE